MDQVWLEILPKYQDRLPDLEKLYLPGAYAMQKMARGQAFVIDWYPSGPLLEYAPDRVKDLPDTAEAFLRGARSTPVSSCMPVRPTPARAARS